MALIIIMVAFFSILIWLQIHLSQKENKWLGRIIPISTFILSLPILFLLVDFSTFYLTDGTETGSLSTMNPGTFITYFIYFNIPTFTFIIIYSSIRSRLKRNKLLGQDSTQSSK